MANNHNDRKETAPDIAFGAYNTNGNLVLATRAEFYQEQGNVVTIALRRREKALKRVDPKVALGWGLGELMTQVTILQRQDPVWVYGTIAVPNGVRPEKYGMKIGNMFVGKLDKYAVFSPARLMAGLAPFGLKIHSQPEGSAKNPLAASLSYVVQPYLVSVTVNLRKSVLNGTMDKARAKLAEWHFRGFNTVTDGWVTATCEVERPDGDIRDYVYKMVAHPVTAMIQTL